MRDLLDSMWRIRAFEEKVSELYARGTLKGLLHLGIGQEGVAVGACAALDRGDYVVGGHRSHAHAIAKGAELGRMLAELAGRDAGYCRGKGGSMHLVAMDCGFVTATGVVGGNIPLAVGTALACRLAGRDRVTVVFFGDGAAQTGAFHESLNLASLWGLPLVFVCENNGYAEFSALEDQTTVRRLAEHGETYGIPARTLDGNDVLAVRESVAAAAGRARAGDGPTFLECLTYRLRGHYEGDPGKYRELSEAQEWRAKDPIARLVRVLDDPALVEAAEAGARAEVEAAAAWALAQPEPAGDEVATTVYAT
ncbi:MAG: thiamine pyrophosphate-dependent dehydrogenase E1 component subunit alpha [Thermoleophilia bacterium]|nr:thiamine pyrophosphate-dependent dehydrogenase E1 component subunit alpha [Thermoleophilia bacterium]